MRRKTATHVETMIYLGRDLKKEVKKRAVDADLGLSQWIEHALKRQLETETAPDPHRETVAMGE